MRIQAIYARQSVDRADSLSIESQIELCAREAGGGCAVYADRGYSGKNTDRPAFRRLMEDVAAGRVARVIVYRLDRISRSVLDFAGMIDEFRRCGVSFSSTVEKFDTASPIGNAMLMLVMIFAQLERETIQQRVADAYAARSRRGLYMGGRVPYGFALREITLGGVRTRCYAPLAQESAVLRQIFALYAAPEVSLGDVAAQLRAQGVRTRSGAEFTRHRVRDMIVNPIYVRADERVRRFFEQQGAQVVNPPADFIGVHGAYLYSGDSPKRRTASLAGHTLVLAPHEGIVDAALWLRCREKCLRGRASAGAAHARRTWLAGKLRCACCGYALTVKIGARKRSADVRYYICSFKYAGGGPQPALRADEVDALVLDAMQRRLASLPLPAAPDSAAAHRLRAQLRRAERERQALPPDRPDRAAALETRCKTLRTRLRALESAPPDRPAPALPQALALADKAALAACLIESVEVSTEEVCIVWRV